MNVGGVSPGVRHDFEFLQFWREMESFTKGGLGFTKGGTRAIKRGPRDGIKKKNLVRRLVWRMTKQVARKKGESKRTRNRFLEGQGLSCGRGGEAISIQILYLNRQGLGEKKDVQTPGPASTRDISLLEVAT